MRVRSWVTHRRGITNVYTDLGYRAPESMLVKGQLVSRIAELLAERGMTQAPVLLDIPQLFRPSPKPRTISPQTGVELIKLAFRSRRYSHAFVDPERDQQYPKSDHYEPDRWYQQDDRQQACGDEERNPER